MMCLVTAFHGHTSLHMTRYTYVLPHASSWLWIRTQRPNKLQPNRGFQSDTCNKRYYCQAFRDSALQHAIITQVTACAPLLNTTFPAVFLRELHVERGREEKNGRERGNYAWDGREKERRQRNRTEGEGESELLLRRKGRRKKIQRKKMTERGVTPSTEGMEGEGRK